MSLKSELLNLKKNGLLHPEDAERWAREHPDSELHRSLEWDDTIAGRKWRLEQVRQLIRIHVVTETGERELISLSIDRAPQPGGYRKVSDVLSKRNLRQVMLEDAFAELDRIEKKYNSLDELSPIWAEKEQTREALKHKASKRRKHRRDTHEGRRLSI